MIQKTRDEGRVDILQRQASRRLAQRLLGKVQKQSETVPIGFYRSGAHITLLDQALDEETL
jgi:hypothetical protein